MRQITETRMSLGEKIVKNIKRATRNHKSKIELSVMAMLSYSSVKTANVGDVGYAETQELGLVTAQSRQISYFKLMNTLFDYSQMAK